MNLELVEFKLAEKRELRKDLMAYFLEIDARKVKDGLILEYPYLDAYWVDKNRIPLKIVKEGAVLGFVLINDFVVNKSFNASKAIAEFYIKPIYRRKGIGKKVAHQIFEKYNHKWEVRQSVSNIKAQKFWRHVIGEYTQNNFEELLFEAEYIQLFTT